MDWLAINKQVIEDFRATGGQVGGHFAAETGRVIPVFRLVRN